MFNDYSKVLGLVESLQKSGELNKENYWIYFTFNGYCVTPQNEPREKRPDSVGYFVEDNIKLRLVCEVAQKKIAKMNR